jgi:hypothetical protein
MANRRHVVALGLVMSAALALGACHRSSPSAPKDWRRELKPHVVGPDDVKADPAGAARKAVEREDWRLIALPPLRAADDLPGLVCSVPRSVRELATISYMPPDVLPVAASDPRWKTVAQPDAAAIALFNRIVANADGSPWRGLCVDEKSWHNAMPPEPWLLLVHVKASPWARLNETIRLGEPDPPSVVRDRHWDPHERDLFGMNALSWAVARRDREHVAWLTEPPNDDLDDWCELGSRDPNETPPAWRETDPLFLAVDRKDAEFAMLLLPVRSERKCPARRSHRLFQMAWSTVLATHQDMLVEPMLREMEVADQPRQIALAQQLHRAGYDVLASNVLFGPARIDETLPLAGAASKCNAGDTAFWLTETRRRGRQQDIEVAWAGFNQGAGWHDAKACAATMSLFAAAGMRVLPDSTILARAVAADIAAGRANAGRALSKPEAEAILAAFRSAGGNAAAPAKGVCMPAPDRKLALFCTPAEIAERGETVFRAAQAKGCVAPLDDRAVVSITAACLARGGQPLFIAKAALAEPDPDLCHVRISAPDRDRQLAACRARHAERIVFN